MKKQIARTQHSSPCVGRFLLSVALLAQVFSMAPLVGQATWIVAPQPGVGVHFTTLQSAVDATQVRDGDTLRIRRGAYRACVVSKGVRFIGEPGATIEGYSLTANGTQVEISGLSTGKCAILEGLVFETEKVGGVTSIGVIDCAGSVLVENCTVSPKTTSNIVIRSSVDVQRSNCVSLRDCNILGNGIRLEQSNLMIQDCVVGTFPPNMFGFPGRPAIYVWDGHVEIVGGSYKGADGWIASTYGNIAARPSALSYGASSLRISGGALLESGFDNNAQPFSYGSSAIDGNGSTSIYHALDTKFLFKNVAITGAMVVPGLQIPTIRRGDDAPGIVNLRVQGAPSSVAFLFAGTPLCTSLGGVAIAIDPANFVLLGGIGLSGYGDGRLAFRFPSRPHLWTSLAFQVFSFSGSTLESKFSTGFVTSLSQ